MEESISFGSLRKRYDIKEADINTFSPLTFAYIGDSVFDVIIRSIVVARGNTPVSKMHNACSRIVCAASQAEILDAITDELFEEEADMVRRGRNAKPKNSAKNATQEDYRNATAFETLIGYLYMKGQNDRLNDLVMSGLKKTGKI